MRNFIAKIGMWILLKALGLTSEQYWEEVYQQEKQFKKNNNFPL